MPRAGAAVSAMARPSGDAKPAYETIRLSIEGRIARLILHRPDKLNAHSPEMPLARAVEGQRLMEQREVFGKVMLTP